MTVQKDDESMDLSEAIRHFEEMHRITAEELKETDDWRNMSEDQWDKLLEGVDEFIDAQIERLRDMKEVQEEAARKAVMMAPPDMRTVAASQAALDVAASGFMGATEPDAGTEHEKNWTRNLVTDDQVVLRTAKAAREMAAGAQAGMTGAAVNTTIDFISWYEQQLALERKDSPNSNNRGQ